MTVPSRDAAFLRRTRAGLRLPARDDTCRKASAGWHEAARDDSETCRKVSAGWHEAGREDKK